VVSVQGHVDSRAWLKQEIHSVETTTERREIVLDTNYMTVKRRGTWWYVEEI